MRTLYDLYPQCSKCGSVSTRVYGEYRWFFIKTPSPGDSDDKLVLVCKRCGKSKAVPSLDAMPPECPPNELVREEGILTALIDLFKGGKK